MKKILLLTDFSEASLKAIHFAQHLFDAIPAEFYLMHVYPVEPSDLYIFPIEDVERSVKRKIRQFLADSTSQSVPDYHSYHTLTAPGDPVRTVVATLEKTPYDYVVVGATGSGCLPVLGSVATGLIRKAKTHVLVVPQNVNGKPIREVVLAMDYTTLNQVNCLQALEELVHAKKSRLTGLSIVDNRTPMWIGQEFEEYRQRFAHVFDSVETGSYLILDEEVTRGIDTYLTTHPVDLLVTVPHRKTLLDAVWDRSLTRRLAYKPRVPLLALYDPELSDKDNLSVPETYSEQENWSE
ncbi:universal stress protein [Larkinella sp. C7]|uniref:universal stress protein n=1 Tax=Larkinella sp. C7 TaxID=2576607 RepID=UPI001BB1FDEF|nr:universal stress protein [Larkinella sp. C7]